MIQLTVDLTDAASIAKASAILATLANAGVSPTEVSGLVPPARPRTKPVVEKVAPPKEEPKPETPAEDDLLGEAEPIAPIATRDDAAKAIVELSKKKGRAAAVKVLEKFRPDGYTEDEVKLPVVDKANYGKLVAEAKKALAAE